MRFLNGSSGLVVGPRQCFAAAGRARREGSAGVDLGSFGGSVEGCEGWIEGWFWVVSGRFGDGPGRVVTPLCAAKCWLADKYFTVGGKDMADLDEGQDGAEQHTVGPWRAVPNGAAFNLCGVDRVPFALLAGMTGAPEGERELAANVSLIVRAVNAHDDLLAVLVEVQDGGAQSDEPAMWGRIHAAIEKATR